MLVWSSITGVISSYKKDRQLKQLIGDSEFKLHILSSPRSLNQRDKRSQQWADKEGHIHLLKPHTNKASLWKLNAVDTGIDDHILASPFWLHMFRRMIRELKVHPCSRNSTKHTGINEGICHSDLTKLNSQYLEGRMNVCSAKSRNLHMWQTLGTYKATLIMWKIQSLNSIQI